MRPSWDDVAYDREKEYQFTVFPINIIKELFFLGCNEVTLKSILRASEDIPGMITVILLGPLNPRTFVSYITATSSWR